MSKDKRPIEVGDRFESKDKRDGGRIVEVVDAEGLEERGADRIAGLERDNRRTIYGVSVEDHIEWTRQRHTHFRIRTEVHPKNPTAVGRTIRVQENTLRDRFKRISR